VKRMCAESLLNACRPHRTREDIRTTMKGYNSAYLVAYS